jgi:transposase
MSATSAGSGDGFELRSELLGAMPIVNHFLKRLSVAELFDRCVPHDDRRMKLAPAIALGVVVRNLVLHREPVYALSEWAAPFSPSTLGLGLGEAHLLNDDRVGRTLLRLFDADRASLMTALVLGAIAEFEVDCAELHNDSTSVTFSGAYRSATGAARGSKATAPIAFGHNKDHRADLKQLVWILTVAADGAVPVAYRVEGGATNDDTTHVPTWDALVKLLGRTDFLYVADTKLANRKAMAHIAGHDGRFVTVLPRTRKEDAFFRSWIQDHAPTWAEATRRPSRRPGEADNVWRTTPSPVPSAEGYRIVWVHSSLEAALDADSRQSRIQRAVAALSDLAARVSSPKSRWHTRSAVEAAAQRELASANAARWVSIAVHEHEEESFRQERRGRPGQETRYRRTTRTRFSLTWNVDTALVAYDAKSDGCFPLVTNDTSMSDAEVLTAYKYQPHLERRHAQLKGVQLVAPVFLKDVARIEGLLCCHFVALLTQALVERQIRRAMAASGITSIPLYPEDRECGAPSAPRIFEIFSGLARHDLVSNGQIVQTFAPKLTRIQAQVLDLLKVPHSAYGITS